MATQPDEVYSAEHLHEKLAIPRRYLRRLLTNISRYGYIRSTKGRSGGFVFNNLWENINLGQIIKAVEGNELMKSCILGFHQCSEDKPCVMHETWKEAKSKMMDTLAGTTLLDLHEKYDKQQKMKLI